VTVATASREKASREIWTVNCSILLTQHPLLERPAIAAGAGFGAVEFWWPFAGAVPGDAELDRFVNAIRDAGVQLTGLNTYAGDMPAGDRGLVSWPSRESEFRDNVEAVAGIGEALGCRMFNALYGNRLDAVRPEQQDELAVENLAFAAETFSRIGGTVLIEPISGIAAYPLRTAAAVLGVIARVRAETGRDELRLLADLYHLAVNGDDVAAAIEVHAGEFGHIQIADSPGRGAPGTGDLPLRDWLARSRALGYRGRVGLEYAHPSADAFGWLDELDDVWEGRDE